MQKCLQQLALKATLVSAETFVTEAKGSTPLEAFEKAKAFAQTLYGSSGYTGSVAEKENFTMVSKDIMESSSAYNLADKLVLTTYRDKWGPAGCIQLKSSQNQNIYLFFGWASA